MRISDLKLSVSGIRGIVGKSLTPELIIKFAEAFSTYIGGGKIAVASDTRPSAEMVRKAVMAGILSCGAVPVDLGVLPIPSLQVYTREKNLAGAISITASHNPIEWNALKLIRKGGHFLYPYEAEELLDVYYQGRFGRVVSPGLVERDRAPFALHSLKLEKFVDGEIIRKKRLRAVVDPCGGAASPYVEDFLESLGVAVLVVHRDLEDGFPRNPEPLPENLGTLCEAVRKHKADVGFAQDADADRLAVVDETGTPIGEEYTLALAVDHYLHHKAKTPVVVNLSTSRLLDDIARKAGVRCVRTKVGEVHVARKMDDVGSRIGGEGNGGIIVSDVHTCRDSFSGMALILEWMAFSGKKISKWKSTVPQYVMVKHKIPVSFREGKRILARLREAFAEGEVETLDGLKVTLPDFWFHVRPSNTEPVLRIIVEGKDTTKVHRALKDILGVV